MGGMEQRLAIGHGRIGSNDTPDHVAFESCRGRAEERRHPGEGIEVVIDQDLTGNADHLTEGLDAVFFLGLANRAALVFTALIDFLELRGFTKLQTMHVLEVRHCRAPRDRREGPGCHIIGRPQGLVGDIGEDQRKVRSAVQGPCRDFVAGQAAHADPLGFEKAPRQFDER